MDGDPTIGECPTPKVGRGHVPMMKSTEQPIQNIGSLG